MGLSTTESNSRRGFLDDGTQSSKHRKINTRRITNKRACMHRRTLHTPASKAERGKRYPGETKTNKRSTLNQPTSSPVNHAFRQPGSPRGEHDEHRVVKRSGLELYPDRPFPFLRPIQSYTNTTIPAKKFLERHERRREIRDGQRIGVASSSGTASVSVRWPVGHAYPEGRTLVFDGWHMRVFLSGRGVGFVW